jgi:hypothetical protein
MDVSDPPLLLVTLSAPDYQYGDPIRYVPDVLSIDSNGNTYSAFALQIGLPTDAAVPRATLTLGNVDKQIMPNIMDGSLRGAVIKLEVIRRSEPDVVEAEIDLIADSIRAEDDRIVCRLVNGAELGAAAVRINYNNNTAPGLFE